MKLFGRTIAAATALFAISATPSLAVNATIADLGANPNVALPSPVNSVGLFSEDYVFQIQGGISAFSASVTNVFFLNPTAKIDNLNLEVFSCLVCAVGPANSTGAAVAGLTFNFFDGPASPGNVPIFVASLFGNLGPGNYFLRVTGNGGAAAAYGGPVSNTVTPSEVPLPGALPLFATGLGALAFVVHRRRRKARAAV